MSTPKRVAVSYSWSTDDAAEERESVAAFCEALSQAGIEVLRDKDDVAFGDDLSEFMRTVGGSDLLCVFLSPAYLRSPNCMYELLIAWNVCKADPASFRDRVKVWTMPGVEIHNNDSRDAWIDYWSDKYEKSSARLEKRGDKWGPNSHEEHFRIKSFANEIDHILGFVGNTLNPRSFADFAAWVEEEFPAQAGADPTTGDPPEYESSPTEIEAAFNKTLTAMNEGLARSSELAAFLSGCTPSLLLSGDPTEPSKLSQLAPAAGEQSFDPCPALEGIARAVYGWNAPLDAYAELERFAGGLAVLGIDSRWMVQQRKLVKSPAVISYPGHSEVINLEPRVKENGEVEKENAFFLYVLFAGLADGLARLDRVFGPPPNLPPPPPGELAGVDVEDKKVEVKRHFILYVLREDASAWPLERVNDQFENVRGILASALEPELPGAENHPHRPYVGTQAYAPLQDIIHKHLNLTDFYIIQPKMSGSTRDIYTNPFRAMNFLRHIHRMLKSKRGELS